ncbi:MAG TPA: hypothetical protein VLJ39_12425, partial [Tepidisphaeraceae bacterium]|nr:hypothetical protein [Tepidisphaeraceae bacterium]
LVASGSGGVDEPFIVIGMVLVYGSGLGCAVTSCGLGILAIRQIRRSEGKVRGLGLALFDALLYPLIALDAFIVMLFVAGLNLSPPDETRVGFIVFLLTLGLDVFIVRWVWRRISRPRLPGQQPPAIPRDYALRPRARTGCFAAVGVAAVLLLLVVAGLLLPYVMRHREQARIDPAQGGIYADPYNDGTPAESGSYRFHVRSPINCKTTLWAELWRDGKRVREPGFDSTFWVIAPAGQPFDGVVTYELAKPETSATPAAPANQVKAGWRVAGTAGSYLDEKVIADPFAGLPLRDSTWGVWTGQWGVRPNTPVHLLVLRGGKHELPGSPSDPSLAGAANVEVRVFAQFDRLVTPSHNPRILFGQLPTIPTTATSDPAVAPRREE